MQLLVLFVILCDSSNFKHINIKITQYHCDLVKIVIDGYDYDMLYETY